MRNSQKLELISVSGLQYTVHLLPYKMQSYTFFSEMQIFIEILPDNAI